MRVLASLSKEEAARVEILKHNDTVQSMITFIRQGASSMVATRTQAQQESMSGNSALCLSELAKVPGAPAKMYEMEAVPALVNLMSKLQAGTKKNAAIALARMASEPRCLARIRDMQGIEMMHVIISSGQ